MPHDTKDLILDPKQESTKWNVNNATQNTSAKHPEISRKEYMNIKWDLKLNNTLVCHQNVCDHNFDLENTGSIKSEFPHMK